MIHARLSDAPYYRGIHPRLDRVLALLTPDGLAGLGTERRELEGGALYVTRFDYETLPREQTFFESHLRYLDVHVMLEGVERVELAHPASLSLLEQSGDFLGWRGEAEQSVLLRPGDFLVVFPGDAHRLKIAVGAPAAVSKAVFKILFRDEELL